MAKCKLVSSTCKIKKNTVLRCQIGSGSFWIFLKEILICITVLGRGGMSDIFEVAEAWTVSGSGKISNCFNQLPDVRTFKTVAMCQIVSGEGKMSDSFTQWQNVKLNSKM